VTGQRRKGPVSLGYMPKGGARAALAHNAEVERRQAQARVTAASQVAAPVVSNAHPDAGRARARAGGRVPLAVTRARFTVAVAAPVAGGLGFALGALIAGAGR